MKDNNNKAIPPMAAGIADRLCDTNDIVECI